MQSFEPEIQNTLRPLLPLLPSDKASLLGDHLQRAQEEDKPQIPYEFLKEIARWVQTNAGSEKFKAANLQAERYSTISLLAGSVTSPRSFPPPSEAKVLHGRETFSQTTKEMTALVNCVITIIGAAVAAWFATSKAGWRNEWRILFALLSSALVAIIELALIIAWSSRAERKIARKRAKAKKIDLPKETVLSPKKIQQVELTTTLRKRNKNNLDDQKAE